MQTGWQSRWARWRALCAALALLFGAVSAPLALAGDSAGDVCSMVCCVEQGHCCCKPRHASVEGRPADGKPRMARTEVAAPCPPDCAGSSVSSPSFSRQAVSPAGRRMDERATPALHSPPPVSRSRAAINNATAPRAPPARLLHFAS